MAACSAMHLTCSQCQHPAQDPHLAWGQRAGHQVCNVPDRVQSLMRMPLELGLVDLASYLAANLLLAVQRHKGPAAVGAPPRR